jgi:hypothetical protein
MRTTRVDVWRRAALTRISRSVELVGEIERAERRLGEENKAEESGMRG